MIPHTPEEGDDIGGGVGEDQLTIVEDKAYPEVVHEDGESGHDSDNAPWSTELIPMYTRKDKITK